MKVLLKKQTLYVRTCLALIVVAVLLSSCASNTVVEEDPNFLGDFSPMQLENVMCLREAFGKLKPTEVKLFFVPRTNVIEAHMRDGMTDYVLLFSSKNRRQFVDGIEIYAQAYSSYLDGNTSTLPEREPDRKNYFNAGNMSVAWGVTSTIRNNTTTFQTNYKYLEPNKPYFELMVEATRDKGDQTVMSPVLRLYFTPTQLEALLLQINQDNLQKLVDELEKAAFTF